MSWRITRGRASGDPLFREHGKQVAALCWRSCLEQTARNPADHLLNSKRWILPKGWLMEGLSAAESAAREAFEEAGVAGKIGGKPIGSYHYLKEKKDGGGVPCRVDVFALQVTAQMEAWPEKGAREIASAAAGAGRGAGIRAGPARIAAHLQQNPQTACRRQARGLVVHQIQRIEGPCHFCERDAPHVHAGGTRCVGQENARGRSACKTRGSATASARTPAPPRAGSSPTDL